VKKGGKAFMIFHPSIQQEETSTINKEILIKFKEGTPYYKIKKYHQRTHAKVVEVNKDLGFHVILTNYPIEKILRYYNSISDVDYARLNTTFQIA
jgi:hypothetical protein